MPLDPTTPEGMAYDEQRRKDAHRLMNSLKAAIKTFPSLRVGQLLDNCLFRDGRTLDLAAISNRELAEQIERYMKQG